MEELSFELIARIGELSHNGYVIYDYKNNIVEYSNKSFARMVDYDLRSGYSLTSLREIVLENDAFIKSCLREFVKAKTISNVEVRIHRNRYVSVDGYLLSDTQLMLVVRDITQFKEYISYITDYGARKDAILGMVAHNLTAPLHLTKDLLALQAQRIEEHQFEAVGHHAQLIRQNTEHCIEIINSFLKEEHLASARVVVEAVRFDAIEKIRTVIERLVVFEKRKTVTLESSLQMLYITSDDVKFLQIIHNILSNAVKFTPADGTIRVLVDTSEDTFSVTVEDNGIGIPPILHPHIFERNTPAGRLGLKGEKSIGMGLFVVQQLVTLMGGRITFSSNEHVGTSFTVILPKVRLRES